MFKNLQKTNREPLTSVTETSIILYRIEIIFVSFLLHFKLSYFKFMFKNCLSQLKNTFDDLTFLNWTTYGIGDQQIFFAPHLCPFNGLYLPTRGSGTLFVIASHLWHGDTGEEWVKEVGDKYSRVCSWTNTASVCGRSERAQCRPPTPMPGYHWDYTWTENLQWC